jgi:hypothetical protein
MDAPPTRFPHDCQALAQANLFDANKDRGVGVAEITPTAADSRRPDPGLCQATEQRIGVTILHNGKYELHQNVLSWRIERQSRSGKHTPQVGTGPRALQNSAAAPA